MMGYAFRRCTKIRQNERNRQKKIATDYIFLSILKLVICSSKVGLDFQHKKRDIGQKKCLISV